MKKWMIAGLMALILAGCSEDTTTVESPREEPKQEETKPAEEPKEETNPEETGEATLEGMGKVKTVGVGYSDEIGIDGTDAPVKPVTLGPMKLSINGIAVVDVEPDEDGKALYFNEQDKARAILVDMKAENTSDKDVTFNPNQAIITTDTGEQIESEMMLMGEAGGDFLGKVTKEGQTWWLVKDLDKDIKKLTLVISSPYDTNSSEDLAEEKRIEIDVLSWEEAKKKDGE